MKPLLSKSTMCSLWSVRWMCCDECHEMSCHDYEFAHENITLHNITRM